VAYGNVYVGSYEDCSLYCLSASVPEPSKTETTITYEMSSTTVTVGSYITINGTINPAPASLPPVTAVFTRPDGTSAEVTTAAVSSGYFELSYQPDVEGVWNVRAFWSGDDVKQGASTLDLVFTVNNVPPSGPQQQSQILGSVPYELLVATAIFLLIMVFEVIFLYSRKKRIEKTKPTANTVRITIISYLTYVLASKH